MTTHAHSGTHTYLEENHGAMSSVLNLSVQPGQCSCPEEYLCVCEVHINIMRSWYKGSGHSVQCALQSGPHNQWPTPQHPLNPNHIPLFFFSSNFPSPFSPPFHSPSSLPPSPPLASPFHLSPPSSPHSFLLPFLPIPLLSPSNLAESNPVGGLVHLLRVQDVFYTLFVWKTSVCQFSGLQSTIASTELRECHVLRKSCMVWVCGVVYMCVCVLWVMEPKT